MCGFMCGLGNQIIAHAHHLGAFICARDRLALLTITALDAQDGRKESRLLQDEYGPIRKSQLTSWVRY